MHYVAIKPNIKQVFKKTEKLSNPELVNGSGEFVSDGSRGSQVCVQYVYP